MSTVEWRAPGAGRCRPGASNPAPRSGLQRLSPLALLYAMALLPISLLPTLLGVTGSWYFFGALVLGIGYVAAGTGLLIGATPGRAWRLFFVSILYLPALLTLMVLDKAS